MRLSEALARSSEVPYDHSRVSWLPGDRGAHPGGCLQAQSDSRDEHRERRTQKRDSFCTTQARHAGWMLMDTISSVALLGIGVAAAGISLGHEMACLTSDKVRQRERVVFALTSASPSRRAPANKSQATGVTMYSRKYVKVQNLQHQDNNLIDTARPKTRFAATRKITNLNLHRAFFAI